MDWAGARRLLRLVRPYRARLAAAAVASLVALGASLAIPILTEHLVNDAILGGQRGLVVPLAFGAFGLGAVRSWMNYVRLSQSGLVGLGVSTDLRSDLFARILTIPPVGGHRWRRGELLARTSSDLEAVREFLGFPLIFLTFTAVTVVAAVVVMATIDVPLTVVAMVLLLPLCGAAVRFNTLAVPAAATSRAANGELATVVEERVAAIEAVKSQGREEASKARLDQSASRLRTANLALVRLRSWYAPNLTLCANLALALTLLVGGYRVIHHDLSLGALVAFNQYVALVALPLGFAGWYLVSMQQTAAAVPRIFAVLDAEPAVAQATGASEAPTFHGRVTLEGVSLVYPGAAAPALVQVSLDVEAGETVGLTGLSGSGKSTLASLIPRFLDPTSGRVLVDGIDVSTVTLKSLRSQIGVMFDEPLLWPGSIRENLVFGRKIAGEAELLAALDIAGAARFVLGLPHGLDTVVGEGGATLSGGQRQRIALARAVLGDPPIVVLDEPLSSVDVETEAEVLANLRRFLARRTAVVISQRPAVLSLADRVIVLETGKVAGDGEPFPISALQGTDRTDAVR